MSTKPATRFTQDTKRIPFAALRMAAASVELGQPAAADGKSPVPVTIVARSPQPVDHWFFGRIVHDFAGMKRAEKISLDYCHDDKEILGFGDKFEVDETLGLVVSGALTPFSSTDRASEVIHKWGLGVPYEASIFFDPDALILEFVPEGMATEVNGFKFEGPGVVARQWLLRNLAICPNGQDKNTAVEFSAGKTDFVEVQTMPVGKAKSKLSKKAAPKKAAAKPATKLSKSGKKPPQSATQFAEGDEEDDEKTQQAEEDESTEEQTADESTTEDETQQEEGAAPKTVTCPNCDHEFEPPADESEPEGETEEVEMTEDEEEGQQSTSKLGKKTGKDFLAAFGAKGGVWFAEGKTFAQAQALFNKEVAADRDRLAKENKELRSKLSRSRGEKKPVNFSSADEGDTSGTVDPNKVAALGKNLSRFATGVKLPNRRK